jgi:hypothetical protein
MNFSTIANNAVNQLQNGTHTIKMGMQTIKTSCLATVEKTETFIRNNLSNILFFSSSCATAYFSPHLFVAGAILAVVIRLEIKHLFNEYIQDQHNPYIEGTPFGPDYVESTGLVAASLAAIHSIALGTLFLANSMTVRLFPIVGGIAAGNVLAKIGMDLME